MAIQPTLNAQPDVIVIDTEVTNEGNTTVMYSKEAEHAIWHRWKPGDWLRVSLQTTGLDDPRLVHGQYDSPKLRPGMIYEAQIWERGVDPNRVPNIDRPPKALASIVVAALRKRPEAREFLQDENERSGGTYREHQIVTSVPVRAFMQVSRQAPQIDADGLVSFAQVDGSAWDNIDQSFLLHIFDLLPGTDYFEATRLIDEYGNWQILQRNFTTLKRRIRLQPIDIDIIDDSDDWSTGEGDFSFAIETGTVADPNSWKYRVSLNYSDNDFDTGGKIDLPVPREILELGPEAVTQASKDARIKIHGRDNDVAALNFAGDEDDLADGYKDIVLPTNTVYENVDETTDSIEAGGDLRIRASYKYWVDYF